MGLVTIMTINRISNLNIIVYFSEQITYLSDYVIQNNTLVFQQPIKQIIYCFLKTNILLSDYLIQNNIRLFRKINICVNNPSNK